MTKYFLKSTKNEFMLLKIVFYSVFSSLNRFLEIILENVWNMYANMYSMHIFLLTFKMYTKQLSVLCTVSHNAMRLSIINKPEVISSTSFL